MSGKKMPDAASLVETNTSQRDGEKQTPKTILLFHSIKRL
jgi:hypothetical protein